MGNRTPLSGAWTRGGGCRVTSTPSDRDSLIPEGTTPPIHLNAEKMKLYRPELERYIYDETRYNTYLEQLGIPYPPAADTPTEPDRGTNR